MKIKIAGLYLGMLLVFFSGISSYGQMKEGFSGTAEISSNRQNKEKLSIKENAIDFYLKKPFIAYLKNGQVVRGYLMSNETQNPDAILVESNSEYLTININDILRLQFLNDPFDTIKMNSLAQLIPDNDFKARIDELFRRLANDPNAQGYILYYSSRFITDRQLGRKEDAVREHINERNFDASRITNIMGGSCGKVAKIELFVIPAGGSIPNPQCVR